MEKIKKITLHLRRWHAGFMLSAAAIMLSYLLAATCRYHHGAITMFHIFGMLVTGGAGVVLFVVSAIDMWEKWDA